MNYSKEQSPPSMANAQGNHMPMGGLNQMNANNMMNPPQENPYLQQHQPKGQLVQKNSAIYNKPNIMQIGGENQMGGRKLSQ